MPKTVLLITCGVGIVILGIAITGYVSYENSVDSPGNFLGRYPPDSPGIFQVPVYEGDSSPSRIPPYENDAIIDPVEPNE